MEAFSGCSNLREISLPSKLEEINYMAFSYCESLEEIRFPESIKYIDSSSLFICNNLKRIEVPSSIKNDFRIIKKRLNFDKVYPEVIYY